MGSAMGSTGLPASRASVPLPALDGPCIPSAVRIDPYRTARTSIIPQHEHTWPRLILSTIEAKPALSTSRTARPSWKRRFVTLFRYRSRMRRRLRLRHLPCLCR